MSMVSVLEQREGGALIVAVRNDRIDSEHSERFKEEMRAILGGWDGPVIVDLSEVAFIDSTGLGAIVSLFKSRGAAGPLELAGLIRPVRKVFDLTCMSRVITIHDRLEAV